MTSKEVVLGQIYQAFGQGTGAVRVSRRAVHALGERYQGTIDAAVVSRWDELAPQILERMRAIGRLAAQLTGALGETAIGGEATVQAAIMVEKVSRTDFCPPTPDTWEPPRWDRSAHQLVMAQIHVAFGQGASVLITSPDGTAALESRYAVVPDEEVLAGWDRIGVQLLERIRAVGRLAFHQACLEGAVAIDARTFLAATETVERAAGCPWCPSVRARRGQTASLTAPG